MSGNGLTLDGAWTEQTRLFQAIMEAGGMENYIQSLPNLGDAFGSDDCLRCIDEGTVDGKHAAGSGIAYVLTKGISQGITGYDAIKAGINAAADAFNQSGITGITSHEECGAAALVYKSFSDDVRAQLKSDHNIETSDQFGDFFAQKLASKMGISYEGRIGITDMARLPGYHIARVTYIDATGKFNPAEVDGFPSGFNISRGYLGLEQTRAEAEVSVSIATGDHGFGSRIDNNNPHMLIGVGDPLNGLNADALKTELLPIAEKFGSKVIVDAFNTPEKYLG